MCDKMSRRPEGRAAPFDMDQTIYKHQRSHRDTRTCASILGSEVNSVEVAGWGGRTDSEVGGRI